MISMLKLGLMGIPVSASPNDRRIPVLLRGINLDLVAEGLRRCLWMWKRDEGNLWEWLAETERSFRFGPRDRRVGGANERRDALDN